MQVRLAILEQQRIHMQEVVDSSQGIEASLLLEGNTSEAPAQQQRTALAKADLRDAEIEIGQLSEA